MIRPYPIDWLFSVRFLGKESKISKKHNLSRLGILRTHYPNANANVESSHRLIEDEFYCIESFSSVKDFLVKASSYQFYFNYNR
ncbi:MAG: hypothetical protein H0Z29_05545 [Candidatus Marinimicrobia bacterium]|nr:hypothetical protein [Candidatus Neomarinimicrobiota bacterium]